MLSIDDAAAYLLERQLIDPAWVIDGCLTITDAARRNGNLKILGRAGAGLLLKQPADPADRGHETLACEAAFYQFCQREPTALLTRDIMPFMVHHDAERLSWRCECYPRRKRLPHTLPEQRSREI